MIPAAFEYVRADSADAAIAALAEHGDDAKLLAGGMSLIPLMKLRLATPTVLVDLGRVTDLSYVRDGGDHVAIGALTRHRDLETSDLLAAADFFHGFLETALAPDELLTEIQVPKAAGGWNYQKFNRRAQDWAIVGALAVRNGSTRVALVNMGATPVRARAVEEALAAGASAADAAAVAAEGTEAPADLNGSSEYREHLARVLVRRALEAAGL